MPHHCEDDGEHGRGTSRRHALKGMIVASLSSMAPFAATAPFPATALDTGDTDEFTFTTAGDFACFCGVRPHRQGKITVAP